MNSQKQEPAPDPKFTWVGTQGYRQTGLLHSDAYVRRRHFGAAEGSWAAKDPLWPAQPAFSYALSSPCTRQDPSGQSVKFNRTATWNPGTGRTLPQKGPHCCGDFDLWWYLTVSYIKQNAPSNGWIIQHLVTNLSGADCGSSGKGQTAGRCGDFYEAFPLNSSGQPLESPFDTWGWDGEPCSHGSMTMAGDLMVVSAIPDWASGTGCVPDAQPSWFSYPDFSPEPGGHASISLQWGCCSPKSGTCKCSNASCSPTGSCFQPELSCSPPCPY